LWKKISSNLPEVKSDSGFFAMFVNWLFGVILVYSILFGTGSLLFGNYTELFIYMGAAIISIFIIYKNLSALGWKTVIK